MDLQAAAIAANRFGYGARPGELKAIAGDPRGWVKAQLAPQPVPAPVAALPPTEQSLQTFARYLAQRRTQNATPEEIEQRARRAGVPKDAVMQLSAEEDFVRTFRGKVEDGIIARVNATLDSPTPAYERLVHFWANHFVVSGVKPAAVILPAPFERDVARRYATGRFADMLMASSKHPGMQIYLDNWLSVGPNSEIAKRPRRNPRGPGRPQGLNENLAREILELQTMGVKGGYSQADVTSLATIITGWNYDRPGLRDAVAEPNGARDGVALFKFEPIAHEPGPKTLLGKTYPRDGLAQGEAALQDIARHPSTARFIATKLCRHYIADAPPPAAVDRVAAAFTRSDGDLRAVMGAVVDSPEVWATPFAKFKRPEEYAYSVLRGLNQKALPNRGAVLSVLGMGQPIYRPPGPDGWADMADNWLSADILWKRIEFADALADRVARSDVDPRALGEALFGPLLSAETAEAVKRAESPAQGLTLLFSSPEFQRR
jgi:uncharacterized protein (DUF1800 family)